MYMYSFYVICYYKLSPRDPDGAVVRPLPRAKRFLSEANTLPHIVQLLLTFDPILVERVVILINIILEDNPNLSRGFSTGVFFFIMMYTGSNILPIAKFLKYSHTKQSFRPDEVCVYEGGVCVCVCVRESGVCVGAVCVYEGGVCVREWCVWGRCVCVCVCVWVGVYY